MRERQQGRKFIKGTCFHNLQTQWSNVLLFIRRIAWFRLYNCDATITYLLHIITVY